MLKLSNGLLRTLPLPEEATFCPNINRTFDGYDMEFTGQGWYGLFRPARTNYYFWRKLALSQDDLNDLMYHRSDTLSDIQRSFGLAAKPIYIEGDLI